VLPLRLMLPVRLTRSSSAVDAGRVPVSTQQMSAQGRMKAQQMSAQNVCASDCAGVGGHCLVAATTNIGEKRRTAANAAKRRNPG